MIQVAFNRTCTVLNSTENVPVRILRIPQDYPNIQRLRLCTGLTIPRTEIAGDSSIRNLTFMENIRVRKKSKYSRSRNIILISLFLATPPPFIPFVVNT